MRKSFLLLSGLLAATTLNAQVSGYYFSQSTGTYTPLPASKTVIISGWTSAFNNPTITAPIDIDFFGMKADDGDFRISHRGQVIYKSYFTVDDFVISAMGAELYGVANATAAEVSYVREGTSPNRIIKVEYKGAGFYTESPHQSSVNFQIWLYEADDAIEFRYGSSTLQSASAYPEDIGLFQDQVGTSIASIELFGNPANPTVGTGGLVDGQHLGGIPAPNTIYRFAPAPTSVTGLSLDASLSVAFNSTDRTILVRKDESIHANLYEVYNLNGQKLASMAPEANSISIDAGTFAPGLYILKASTPRGAVTKKIMVN